ncbi:hypothetical protein WUBG_18702 [Wuchereria bancrofti]|uniref:PH domain-containing protein n=1 Tax=Wuchereria bancrofti TaxID=6293 RepID=J9DL95_WUCBA|nr:hypothetical protein WUBG_18702 [Wuchereria bancrofti]
MYLRGAHICEKIKTAADESSGSSDEQNENHTKDFDHTVSIEIANADPVYIVLRSAEEKDKWIYFLKKAANDVIFSGTAFEVLIQRMLAQNVDDGNGLLVETFFIY